MRISCLQNDPRVGPGEVALWAEKRGYAVATYPLFEKGEVPSLETYDLLVVLGGDPTQCTDWLSKEIETIRSAIENEKGVLGLCLGAQLIAEAMGGKLVPHTHAEVGWWQIRLNEVGRSHPLLTGADSELDLFLFHKNTIILPKECILLAESDGCKHQIFAYRDRVLGFQSHPELTQATILDLIKYKDSMPAGPFVRLSPADAKESDKIAGAWKLLDRALDNMVRVLTAP